MQVTPEMKQKLQAAGLRATAARQAILTSLQKAAQPVAIADLAATTDVDTATIYRNIEPLLAAGLLEAITTGPSDTRYSLAHDHHDHAVCHDCGKIEHITCTTPKAPHLPSFANIDQHKVIYYGICKDCTSGH